MSGKYLESGHRSVNKVSLSGLFYLLGFHEAKELSVGADSDSVDRVNHVKLRLKTIRTSHWNCLEQRVYRGVRNLMPNRSHSVRLTFPRLHSPQ